MDKNQVTGLVLISALLLIYVYFFAPEPIEAPVSETGKTEEVISEQKPGLNLEGTMEVMEGDSTSNADLIAKYGVFAPLVSGEEELVTLENEDVIIKISSKGGKINYVELKKHKTYGQKPLVMLNEESSTQELNVKSNGNDIDLKSLYYTVNHHSKDSVSFTISLNDGSFFTQIYSLPEEGYVLNYKTSSKGLNAITKPEDITLVWENRMPKVEKDLSESRKKAKMQYYTVAGSFDYLSETKTEKQTESIEEPVSWISFKQKFFTSAIIAHKGGFEKAEITMDIPTADTSTVKVGDMVIHVNAEQLLNGNLSFSYFFGPNNYQILKKVSEGFHKNVDLGYPFISWVNKWIIIPIFNWLNGFIPNMGIVIIILVLIIKLVLSPLSYSSYLSMAKMKVLKPELDELKEKTGGDAQKMQQEQMALYRQVGVNPLSGCIPLLLQMPILLAMFYFFPNSIELRQKAFLWADDLSTYDAIISWSFDIPLLSSIYGNHVSLFTLLMTLSTILYTWSNNQVSSVQGPMKSLSYMMPIIFMFVLNSFPAGLSFYYFVSNLVTFGQQAIIRRFVDDGKIRAILEENKKKNVNKKKSSFQIRLEEAMKAKEKPADKKKKK
jgi:YidC/Oxa1 family membrane protein insertase